MEDKYKMTLEENIFVAKRNINGIGSENLQTIVVVEEERGNRIDKFLSEKLELTRTRIQQLIKDENIS